MTNVDVMEHLFFLPDDAWSQLSGEDSFDHIVIGSGFCGLAFVERTLRNDPLARVLVLERGPLLLPEHIQNLPMPFLQTLGPSSEAHPWRLSARMGESATIKTQRGIMPFFGGRSNVWSGWCPRPTIEELHGWPEEVISAAQRYFDSAEALLGVIPATMIGVANTGYRGGPGQVYGGMQQALCDLVDKRLGRVPSLTHAMPAPLAVASADPGGHWFTKFATPGPLLSLQDRQRTLHLKCEGAPLRIATSCQVASVERKDTRATTLETSRGPVAIGEANLIFAVGALPAAELVMRSFPSIPNVGSRYTAHSVSTIIARVPRGHLEFAAGLADLELGALYAAGVDEHSGGQFHLQLTAIADADPAAHAPFAHRYMPDLVATASPKQLEGSCAHVVFVCAIVGELDHRNPDNWVRMSGQTGDMQLQIVANDVDLSVWNAMDSATFALLEQVLSSGGPTGVEYWHGDSETGEWRPRRPLAGETRSTAVMHDASTLWIGGEADPDAVVGLDYRLRGLENTYITGAALWPTAGSWNPTLTMVALAQHLADSLTRNRNR
jgi:choline dehydrogenase-like flavoprotein